MELEEARQSKAVAEGQLRDYESRLGGAFAHDAYQRQLADLRDKLKLGLSERAPEQTEGPTVAELAERIKALRASNAVEAVTRIGAKPQSRGEKPVSARIARAKAEEEPKPSAELIPLPEPIPQPVSQTPNFASRNRNGRSGGQQLSLF